MERIESLLKWIYRKEELQKVKIAERKVDNTHSTLIGNNSIYRDSEYRQWSSRKEGSEVLNAQGYWKSKVRNSYEMQFIGECQHLGSAISAALEELDQLIRFYPYWNKDNLMVIICRPYQVQLVFKLKLVQSPELLQFKHSVQQLLENFTLINDHLYTQQDKTYWNMIIENK